MYNIKSSVYTSMITTFFVCKPVPEMLNYNNDGDLLKQWVKRTPSRGALTLKWVVLPVFEGKGTWKSKLLDIFIENMKYEDGQLCDWNI